MHPAHPFHRDTTGSALVETALVIPVLMLLLLGAVDFSRAYYASIEVNSAAQAGVQYGLANLNDTSGMAAAAKLDAPDVNTMSATAVLGCECADGSGVTPVCTVAPTCSTLLVDYVEVDTATTYATILPYPGLPSPLAISASARMRSNQ